jgi:hypothetical protein
MPARCRSGFSPTILLLAFLLLPLPSFAADVVHQLRIYEIFDHNKQAFHDRFRNHAMRIMTAAKHGQLVGEIQDRTLRLLSYSPQWEQR